MSAPGAAAIEAEIAAYGVPRPPWLRHPEHGRRRLGWRMGSGESYLIGWGTWFDTLPADGRPAYFRRFAPIPPIWADWVAAALGEPVTFSETAAEAEVYARRLAALGLVDLDAWRVWRAKPPRRGE